jgi:4-diphosphocytidyl-2-C-methyl-D-erythritol kinase
MLTFPNAKINLGLNITGKRDDKFHNIESVFYPVNWTDALEIVQSGSFKITLSGIPIDGNAEENLCAKVYHLLKEKFNLPPVHIHLHKNIPVGAGLGGGSSDAAFTTKLLNKKFDLRLSEEEMENIVRPLGSDCAFFIGNKPVFATGKGDIFEKINFSLKGKFILIIFPGIHISTKEAYSSVSPKVPEIRIPDILIKDPSAWKALLKNDFEYSVFPEYPLLFSLKEELYKTGAIYAAMTGSGSAMYGIFDCEPDINLFPESYRILKGMLH